MDKKIFLFLLLGMFMISFCSAFEFDNIKYKKDITFDGKNVIGNKLLERYKPIEIKNSFGLGKTLFEGYLSQHDDTCGQNCKSTMQIKLNQDGVLIDNVIFETLIDNSWVEQNIRSYQFYINDKPYNLGDEVEAGIYEVRLEGEKSLFKTIDWKIATQGKLIGEWAVWASDIVVDLISYYKLDESSGTILDTHGSNNGTYNGALYSQTGKINTAIGFDGTDDEIDTNFNTDFNEVYSVCMWIFADNNIDRGLFSRSQSGVGLSLWRLSGDGKQEFRSQDPLLSVFSNTIVSTGTWHHICWVKNSGTGTFYLDGSPDGVVSPGDEGGTVSLNWFIGAVATGVNNFDGSIDEVGIWSKALTSTEITELYNSNSSLAYPFASLINLNSPVNSHISNTNNNQFNCSAEVIGTTLTNISLWTNETGSWALRNSTTGLSGTTTIQTWNRTFSCGDNILWSCQACDGDGDCGFATENRTLFIDVGLPIINIETPTETLGHGIIGKQEILNVTCTDTNLESCWYNYNGTNISIEGCLTGVKVSTTFTLEEGNLNMTVFANDSVGNENSSFIEWSYRVLENSQTYSSETVEGNIETFKINFTYNSSVYSTVGAKLIYDNTEYAGAKISGTGNTVVYSTDIEIPSVSADEDENKTFYWNILIGTTYQNSTSYNQTVYNLALDDCSVYTNKILNLTIYDEEIQNKINASAVGVELEIAVNIYSSDRNTLVLNLSNQYATNPTAICLNRNLTAEASYSMDSIIRYKSTGYANEYYNIVKFVLTNETPTQNINLYNLNLTDSTEFQLTFIGGDYTAVENALVYVERQYIDENTFKTVELPLTDTNGQTILHLVKNDIIYNFIIMKDGVVLGSFNNMIAFCEDYSIGDCKINLNAFDSVESVFDSDDFYGITFTAPQYNEALNRVTFNFQSIDGSTKTVLMEVTRNDIFGNRSICNSTLVSSGGTIICDIDPNLDESVLRINIYVDGSKVIIDSVQLDSSNYGEAGYLVFFIMAITIILMFSGSKTGILFGIILTFAGAIGLNMISSEIIGIGASGLWLLVIVVIAIWKLNKERIQ